MTLGPMDVPAGDHPDDAALFPLVSDLERFTDLLEHGIRLIRVTAFLLFIIALEFASALLGGHL